MPYLLEDLVVDRVDLVDEGANSAAFIQLFKRKEQCEMNFEEILSKMKPEHAEIIQAEIDKACGERDKACDERNKAQEELATATTERDEALETLKAANEDLATATSELETLKAEKASGSSFDEVETMKSMPEEVREVFAKMREQRDAAEEELRKAKEAEATAQAVAKARELKAIPVDQDKLVGILKSASQDVVDLLTSVNAAIEGTVLGEVGKSRVGGDNTDAWTMIEAKAEEIAKRDSVTKAKAITTAIKENPDLYKEYLNGGVK